MQDRKTFKKNHLEMKYNFGRQVRLLREAAGFSLAELSVQTKIKVEHLQEMELGKFYVIGWVFQLAKFYDKKVRIEFY